MKWHNYKVIFYDSNPCKLNLIWWDFTLVSSEGSLKQTALEGTHCQGAREERMGEGSWRLLFEPGPSVRGSDQNTLLQQPCSFCQFL